MYAHDCSLEDSRMERNVVGIFVMYSNRVALTRDVLSGSRGAAGVGIGCKESDSIRVSEVEIVGNTTGVYLDRTPRTSDAPATIGGSIIARNDVAIRLHGSDAGVTFSGDDFVGNAVLAEVDGGGDALGVTLRENFYTEYVGYDLNHDGFGDVAFEQKRLSGELTDAHPAMRLFEGTTAMGTLDAVARAMPVLAAHRLLVDEKPRMARQRGAR
jgi:nitrous oxidase accessory protein